MKATLNKLKIEKLAFTQLPVFNRDIGLVDNIFLHF